MLVMSTVLPREFKCPSVMKHLAAEVVVPHATCAHVPEEGAHYFINKDLFLDLSRWPGASQVSLIHTLRSQMSKEMMWAPDPADERCALGVSHIISTNVNK